MIESQKPQTAHRESERGFLLVGVIVMIALVLLFLSVAAPVVAKDLRRERELEAVHRGKEYTHAIRLYYKKFNAYPASIEALEKTNNIRYLRKRYEDPMTGKDDWRRIGIGQAKTTVKGFFGEPLAGLGGGGGLGSASGLASAQQPGGQSGGLSNGLSSGQGGGTDSSGGTTATGTASGSSSFGSSSFGSSSFGSSGSSGSGGGGPFVGVGISKEGASVIELNEQTDYSKWEFLYDPRIETLSAKVSLFGGGPASTSAGSLGSASGLASPAGVGGSNGNSSNGGSNNGSNGNNGNSDSGGNGNGNTGNSGTGATGGSTNPTGTPPPPQ